MSVLVIMVPATLLLAAGAVVAFVLSTRRGEFDDLDTPALRMLDDGEALDKKKPTSTL